MQIRGSTQIMPATITNAEIAAAAAIALSKLAEAVIQADGGQAFTAAQSMGGFELTNLANPTADQSATPKAWVLAQIASITGGGKTEVRTMATGNITLSGTQTISGVALSAGQDVMLPSQTAPAENGLWRVAAGAWARSPDADTWDKLTGLLIVVREGTNVADTLWLSTVDEGGTLDTTAVSFIQLPGASDIIAGLGLTRTGQTLDIGGGAGITANANDIAVNVDDSTIEINADALRVKDAGITAAKLAAAVAGDGLTGGAGTALAVNVAGSGGLEIAADAVQINLDGTSLTVGAGGIKVNLAKFIVRETPSGTVNGSNVTFTLANTPASGKEQVFLNGLLQEPGGEDYTLTTNSIAFVAAPLTGDRIRVTYIID